MDPEILIGQCDLISRFSDFALLHQGKKMYEHNALGSWSGLALCLTKVRNSRARCPATALIIYIYLPYLSIFSSTAHRAIAVTPVVHIPVPVPLRVRVTLVLKFSRSPYLDNHPLESIHTWTIDAFISWHRARGSRPGGEKGG